MAERQHKGARRSSAARAARGAAAPRARRPANYSKISGPLLDRIDIQVEVFEVKFRDIVSRTPAESSAAMRAREMDKFR